MAAESRLQIKILNDLRSFGKYCVVFKIMKCGDNAVPDVFFTSMFTGSVFLELKAPGKEPSTAQRLMIKKIKACGGKAYTCNSFTEWVKIKKKIGLELENLKGCDLFGHPE